MALGAMQVATGAVASATVTCEVQVFVTVPSVNVRGSGTTAPTLATVTRGGEADSDPEHAAIAPWFPSRSSALKGADVPVMLTVLSRQAISPPPPWTTTVVSHETLSPSSSRTVRRA